MQKIYRIVVRYATASAYTTRVKDSVGGTAMLDGEKAKVQEETVKWRADDLRQKET